MRRRWILRSSAHAVARPVVTVGLLGALAAGCSDRAPLPTAVPGTPPARGAATTPPSTDRVALAQLTRAVALALSDEGLRARVKNDMRASYHTREHKLELRSYLRGESGGILLAKMAKATGASRDSLLALVAAVRPLEFYMPVREQRERWTGGPDLLVASLINDEDVPTVYDLSGTPYAVGANEKPSLPTFALVPVETNFMAPLDPRRVKQGDDAGGTTIGTLRVADCMAGEEGCETGSPGGGYVPPPPSVPTDAPTGLYMTMSDLNDVGEAWLKGDPEIEAHVFGPGANDRPDLSRSITCAGQERQPPRWFNQNGNHWEGNVLLLSESEFVANRYVDTLPDNRKFYVALYEDDDETCVIHDDPDRMLKQMEQLVFWGAVGYGNILACKKTGDSGAT